MEHSLHIIFLFAGLLVGLVIWFWDSIKNNGFKLRSFTILVIILFSLLHVSPLEVTLASHHPSQDHSSFHPCCMPQTATNPSPLVVPKPILIADDFINKPPIVIFFQSIKNLNTRSPPYLNLISKF